MAGSKMVLFSGFIKKWFLPLADIHNVRASRIEPTGRRRMQQVRRLAWD